MLIIQVIRWVSNKGELTMKRIKNGYGIIAVICLLTAGSGAEELLHEGQELGSFFGESSELGDNNWLSQAAKDDSKASAWSFVGDNYFQFHADFLWHNYDLIRTRTLLQSLSFYYGVGGRMKLSGSNTRNENKGEDSRFGMRSPVGISYVLQEKPFELFAEVVPILDILPETRLGVGVGVGARYYFSLL
jgi:hypothetical protein